MKFVTVRVVTLSALLVSAPLAALAQTPVGTSFTYQGQLENGGTPLNGSASFQFALYDAVSGGNQVGAPIQLNSLPISNGLFTVNLDFGAAAFNGQARWLQISVRTVEPGFTTLTPRQPLTATPFAQYSINNWGLSGNAGTNPATNFIGTTDNQPLVFKTNNHRALQFSFYHDPFFDTDSVNVIAGSEFNSITAGGGGTIAGGGATGLANTVTGDFGTVGGGRLNLAASLGTVAGGDTNSASGTNSTVGGGSSNIAGGNQSVVAGGLSNSANGPFSAVLGGAQNTAGNQYASILGGRNNVASGYASTAAGTHAVAQHTGTFVWSHFDGINNFSSTGDNQFLIRAAGGVGIGTNAPTSPLTVAGTIESTSGGFKFPDGSIQLTAATPDVDVWSTSGNNIYSNNSGNVGIGTATPAQKLSVAGTIESSSGGFRFPDGSLQATAYSNPTLLSYPVGTSAWGQNDKGQTNPPGGTFIAIAAGANFAIAIRTDGTLIGWGDNTYGQINVPAGTFSAVAAGQSHALAIRRDGTLAAWGDNNNGELNVPSGTFTAVSAGSGDSLAIRTDGTLAGWGYNSDGQTTVPGGTFVAIAAGYYHAIGIRSDGTLAGWGNNAYGQINVPGGIYIAVAAGMIHSEAVTTGGQNIGWGDNSHGQCSLGISNVIAIAAGQYHTLALQNSGQVVCWGDNTYGQLTSPSGTFSTISAGANFNIALRRANMQYDGNMVVGGNLGLGIASPADRITINNGALSFVNPSNPVPFVGLDYDQGSDALRVRTNVNSGALNTTAISIQRNTGNVGIGLTNPTKQLNISSGDNANQLGLTRNGTYSIGIGAEGTPNLYLQGGNVGINTTSPGFLLHVNGTAGKPGGGSWSVASDVRLKKNVEPLSGALNNLMSLRGVTFEYIDPAAINELPGQRIGLIAQDVEQVFPDWVENGADGYKRVTYRGFEAVTVEALRELRAEKDAQIDALRAAHEAEIAALNDRLAKLEALVTQLSVPPASAHGLVKTGIEE